MTKKICGFLHIALMEGFSGLSIANELHGRILQSGLYDKSDSIYVCLLGPSDQIYHMLYHVFQPYPKYHVFQMHGNFAMWEWPTIQALKEHANEHDHDIWYMHTKGASNTRADVPAYIRANLSDWRNLMFTAMTKDIATTQHILEETQGAAGPFLKNTPAPHFMGNFWWASAKHLRDIPRPTERDIRDRMFSEMWIGSQGGTLTSLADGPLDDPYGFNTDEARVFAPYQAI
jgi:hypothetical protein